MKTLLRLFALLACGALAATRLAAGFESYKIEPTVNPQYSPAMQMKGITQGEVMFVIDISAEGQLTDWLVLGYTNEELIKPCVEALKQWKITPARLDGRPVPVQAELTIHYAAEGVVVSRTMMEEIEIYLQRLMGYPIHYLPRPANELDRAPARIVTVTPQYSLEAEKQGVRGSVRVHFYIDETGKVRLPAVEGDSHPYLADSAVTALRAWRFEPPMQNGKPVLIAASQEFKFSSK